MVPNCPNENRARDVLAQACQQAGITAVDLTVTVIDSDEHAQRRQFIGSPTFLIEGADPFAAPGTPAAVACRMYPTPAGLSGTPDVAALQDALVKACADPATAADDR